MIIKSFKCLFLLICLIIPNQSFAASDPFPPHKAAPTVADFLPSPNHVYYCSPTGDNTRGDGSINNPWLDLIGAATQVGPGDLIYFRGGTYPSYPYVNFSRSQNILSVDGDPNNPIVITNYPDEIVNYNSVDTIWCMTLGGDHQKLIGTKVGGSYGLQITGGISITGNDCQISGVEFVGGTSNGGDLNPAMLSVPLNDGCDNLKISHCHFRDSKHQSSGNRMACIRFFTTSNSVIEYNIFKNNYELSDCASIYFKDRTRNSTIRYNTFINNSDGIEYFTQGDVHDGVNAYNNLFYNVENPFCFRNETGPNIRVFDNVALSTPNGGAFFYYLNADPVVSSDRGEYFNNVISGTGFSAGWSNNSSNPNNLPNVFDYNLWYSPSDRNGGALWTLPAGYHDHAVTSNNAVSYDANTMTCTVDDNYAGRSVGRNGTTIGGFTWGQGGGGTPGTNATPIANTQSVSVDENSTDTPITLTGSDADGDTLTYTVTSNPANGTLSGNAPNLNYTPDAGYSGSDSFAFVVNDGTVDSSAAVVTITVQSAGTSGSGVNNTGGSVDNGGSGGSGCFIATTED